MATNLLIRGTHLCHPSSDAGYRRELQTWVQGMWDEKDQFIADVLEGRARTDII